jgi:hypothetical protein
MGDGMNRPSVSTCRTPRHAPDLPIGLRDRARDGANFVESWRTTGRDLMHAVIGRVRIKPGHEDETRAMITDHGVEMVQGMARSSGGYWSRRTEDSALVQHSFWLFDTEENARAAEATFKMLRDMPGAPATFISVDVCEVVGQA